MAQPRALISVWHKEGVEELSKALTEMDWQILSTGGTARKLRAAGIPVIDVSEATGHPEVFDGRVKTLHPAVHGGILARREREDDMETLQELGYGPIDLVCVNLYPFVETAAREPPATDSELIEMIDIGGPTMVRSAAKNHKDVIVLTSPSQYEGIIEKLRVADGNPSAIDMETRSNLALESFQETAAYDTAVSNELESRLSDKQTPSRVQRSSQTGTSLRYGENPHQPASFYPAGGEAEGLAAATLHGGKPLSYNNYLDLDGALRLAQNLIHSCSDHEHGCIVIKHTNPCGAAVDSSQSEAWVNALASDPESAFGCVIAFTKEVQPETAAAIGGHFFECMIAPGYHPEALEILSSKKNRRMLSLHSMG
ncbi:MAG TPA: bifunctional phosphoribosylaminoimidazolecarboxamide formyltransferase/IMP cyclohydrolase, partial [Candidatus Thalassarchaeaceae archaeon]